MFEAKCRQCFKVFSGATEEAAIRSLRGHASRVGHFATLEAVEAEPAKPERKPGQRRTAAEKVADGKAANRAKCECGCGGTPAGRKSRFLPGHDAKKLSAELKAAKAAKAAEAV